MEKELLDVINTKKKISISFIQRTFSYGYVKSHKLFNELIEQGYIDSEGNVLKKEEKESKPGINIIFLDVDGVLNCHSTKDLCGPYRGIEDKKVALLKEIVDSTAAIIILVSTWKEYWYRKHKADQDDLADYLDAKLAKQGLKIIDKTDDYNSFDRGDGIIEYLRFLKKRDIKVNKFIILDDQTFDYKERKLTKYLVQTSYNKDGLEKSHVRKAIAMLR